MSVTIATNELAVAATREYRLNVHAAGKSYSLDFRQAFRFGYTLLKTAQFQEAARVFQALMPSGAEVPLLTIMLAYCRAGLKDYQRSRALLCEAFPAGQRDKAEQLHTAFVYLSVGMWADAVEELGKLARQSPDPPVISLLLGDVLAIRGRRVQAIVCWRLAAARDHLSGAVAATARYLIASHTKPPRKHEERKRHGSSGRA